MSLSVLRALLQIAKPIQLLRASSGAYDREGRWQAQSYVQTDVIKAVVQPLDGNELQLVDEGVRARNSIKIYTPKELRIASEKLQIQADHIVFRNTEYQVIKSEPWGDGEYWKSIAVEVVK